MNTYRSKATVEAVQYLGEPIPDVTCGTNEDEVKTCGAAHSSLSRHPHVHSRRPGGLTVLKEGDWILPEPGGPFVVLDDKRFRAEFEVPEEPVADAEPPALPPAPQGPVSDQQPALPPVPEEPQE